MVKGRHAKRLPWPCCQFMNLTAYGAEQCPNNAYFEVTGLLHMETMLACTDHTSEAIKRMGLIYHDDGDEDGPVLVRRLKDKEVS